MKDISAGDSSPKLDKSSLIDSATALNLWYKFVELTNDFTTPLQFNKATLTIGNTVSRNTATDQRGFELQDTTGTKIAALRSPAASNLVYLESALGYPLSLRVSSAEIAQVSATGLGIGMSAAEKLSIGSASNNTNNALAIYAQTSAGSQSFASITQEAAVGSTNFRYGSGPGGTTKHLVFTGSGGNQTFLTSTGDLGLNSNGPASVLYSGARYLTVQGPSGPGVLEFASSVADATLGVRGVVCLSDIGNTVLSDKRAAAFDMGTVGTTANNRGGYARILAKADGGALAEAAVFYSNQVKITPALVVTNTITATSFRANQGLSSGDNGVTGYAFGTDGDTGLFAVGSGIASTNLRMTLNGVNCVDTSIVSGSPYTAFGSTGARPVAISTSNGTISFKGDPGGWAMGPVWLSNDGTQVATIAGVGGGNTFSYISIGPTYSAPWMMIVPSTGIHFQIKAQSNSTLGQIKDQSAATTAGLVVQTNQSGVLGVDGAFITYMNKDGSKLFSAGMDADGEFKVGGGSLGASAKKIYHEGFNPGAMTYRATFPIADADLYRPSGLYQMQNVGNTASFGVLEFSDIGGSASRVQQVFWYGNNPGQPASGDEMYFRVARDSQSNFDSYPTLGNRVWHSGNISPMTTSTDYATPTGFGMRATVAPTNVGDTWFSTPSYATGQGDGRTHFGYLIDASAAKTCYNYIRGARTYFDGSVSMGAVGIVSGRSAKLTISYSGDGSQHGITLNSSSINATAAIMFCTGGTDVSPGTLQGSISILNNTVSYNQTSDLRIKENVKPAAWATSKIKAIEVIEYDLKDTKTHVEYGFAAQQLNAVIKQAVTPGNEGEIEEAGDVWQVDNSKIVPLLVKSQQETIEALESTTNALKDALEMISVLQSELRDLKKKVG